MRTRPEARWGIVTLACSTTVRLGVARRYFGPVSLRPPAMNFPANHEFFRRQSGAGQATARRRCAIASTREEEGARDDPPGTAQGRLDAVVHASKAAGVPCRIVRRPVKFSSPESIDAARP